tara:strand:- start:445 stop:636 length:192 start_codon:yes stop_codon:yes gene_type:complete
MSFLILYGRETAAAAASALCDKGAMKAPNTALLPARQNRSRRENEGIENSLINRKRGINDAPG